MRAVWAPVSPLALGCLEYFLYELLTQNAAAPEMTIPTTIKIM
jgi:hypothetical protein